MTELRTEHPIIHFVGSIPLAGRRRPCSARSPKARGRYLRRLPDGETGIRKTWIRFLQDVLADNPAIELAADVPPFKFTQWDGKLLREIPRLRVKPGAKPDAETFETGYAEMAIASWSLFERLQTGRCHPGDGQISNLAADADRADLQQHGPLRPATAFACTHPAFDRRGCQDRRGDPERPARCAMGCMPGSAGLGGLLRERARRFPHRNDRCS